MASDHEKQVVVGGGSGGWWDEVEASKAWMIVRMIVSGGSNLAAPLKAGERLEVPSVVEVRAVAGQLQAAVVAKVGPCTLCSFPHWDRAAASHLSRWSPVLDWPYEQ